MQLKQKAHVAACLASDSLPPRYIAQLTSEELPGYMGGDRGLCVEPSLPVTRKVVAFLLCSTPGCQLLFVLLASGLWTRFSSDVYPCTWKGAKTVLHKQMHTWHFLLFEGWAFQPYHSCNVFELLGHPARDHGCSIWLAQSLHVKHCEILISVLVRAHTHAYVTFFAWDMCVTIFTVGNFSCPSQSSANANFAITFQWQVLCDVGTRPGTLGSLQTSTK